MVFREARSTDITQIQFVRNSVKENTLSDPSLVTDKDCEEFLLHRGKGWVCEAGNRIVGFSIVDLKDNNIWALFVHPEYEAKGIGKELHWLMLDWYFGQKTEKLWLGTTPGTKAEKFYIKMGWINAGTHGTKEIKFEMSYQAYSSNPAIKQSG